MQKTVNLSIRSKLSCPSMGEDQTPPPPPPTKLTREREIERERGRERERRGGEGVECFHFMFFTKINGRYLPIINITATTAQIPML